MPTADEPEDIAQARLARITPLSRQALLLTAMEGFTPEDAGYLIGASADEVEALVAEALAEIERQTRADVLIIEDEPIIAMDIETIVRDLGHNVTGVAVTRDEAVAQAMARRPGLVLADIQLADDSSGIDAVKDILARILGAGDLHHRLPRAAADRRAAGADLPDHQAVPALDGEGGDRPGPVLRHARRFRPEAGPKPEPAAPAGVAACNEWNSRIGTAMDERRTAYRHDRGAGGHHAAHDPLHPRLGARRWSSSSSSSCCLSGS